MLRERSLIFTNAIDLANMITKLNDEGTKYEITIVKGIDNEDVVKVTFWKEKKRRTA